MVKRKNKSVGFGVASLVTAIIGFFMFLIPYIGIFFSVTAIILSVIQQKRYKTGLATGGLVMGIIGTVSNIMWLGLVALALAVIGI